MPISNGSYVAPTWVNDSSPALDATELQAMCDTIEDYGDPIATVATIPRPNLLANWYLTLTADYYNYFSSGYIYPFNSIGNSTYTGSGIKTIDRWVTSGNVTVDTTSSLLKIQLASNTSGGITQELVDGGGSLIGRTVTLSAIVQSDGSTAPQIRLTIGSTNHTATGTATSGDQLLTVSAYVSSSITYIGPYISGSSGAYMRVRAIKLEVGETQTLAHKNSYNNWVLNELPNYDEEVIKCAHPSSFPARFQTGTYTGTGTYGSNNTNSLTFNFQPQRVIIAPANLTQYELNAGRGQTQANTSATNSYGVTLTWSGTTVTWYSTRNANEQLNTSGTTYYYVAIG